MTVENKQTKKILQGNPMAPVNICSVHFNISYPVKGNELCWQNCGNFLHGVSIGFLLQHLWKRAVRIRFWMFGGKPCDIYRLHFDISYPVEGNELRWQNCGNFLHHLAVQHIMPWKFDLLLKKQLNSFAPTYLLFTYFLKFAWIWSPAYTLWLRLDKKKKKMREHR